MDYRLKTNESDSKALQKELINFLRESSEEGHHVVPLVENAHPMAESSPLLEVKIKYHNGMEEWPLNKMDKGDFIDLRAAETIEMMPGEFRLISLGVSMQLPEGYHAQLVPRSSTFKNFGIIMTNSVGIIDNSYCGDNDIWRFPALCMRATKIEKGERIAQFRIVKNTEQINFETVETLGNADRGGIGSTGVK